MVKIVEMKYIQNDILELSVQLDEHLPFATDNYNNYNSGTDSYLKSENKMINLPYVSSEEAIYNNNFWSNKEQQHDEKEKMSIDTPEHSTHVSSAEAAHNNSFWMKKEQHDKTEKMEIDTPKHSKGRVSSAEAAYNFWIEKEHQQDKKERKAFGDSHSKQHVASARTSYNNNSSIKKEPFDTTEGMSVDVSDNEHSKKYEPCSVASYNNNLPQYSNAIPAINIFRDNKLQNVKIESLFAIAFSEFIQNFSPLQLPQLDSLIRRMVEIEFATAT